MGYVLAQVRLEPELLVMDENTSSEYMAEILENKVALLINIDGNSGLSLATALASRGADVALVIYSENIEQTTKVKKQIEMMGRRCLIIRQEENGNASFSREVVRRTLEEYGRFDIFIDHSYLPERKLPRENQTGAAQQTDASYRTQFSATIDTMAIVLNHMVPNEMNN